MAKKRFDVLLMSFFRRKADEYRERGSVTLLELHDEFVSSGYEISMGELLTTMLELQTRGLVRFIQQPQSVTWDIQKGKHLPEKEKFILL